jgi:hypothetical protein
VPKAPFSATRQRGDFRPGSRRSAHFPSPSEIIPKVSIERPGASKRFQSASQNFTPFPGIEDYQWVTGEDGKKNC